MLQIVVAKRSALHETFDGLEKVDFQWGPDQQKAFKTLKSIMAAECLNAYPDYNQHFKIYTDVSDYQLGAAIIQNKQPIAY